MNKVQMFTYYGRSYKVLASFPKKDTKACNAFMRDNRNASVLAIEGDQVILVSMKDKGVAL